MERPSEPVERREMEQKGQHNIVSDPFIRTATPADAERCLAVLTLAFACDPPCRWAWPDPQQYLEAFPCFARAFGGGAIEHRSAHYYEGFSGVALWLSPGAAPDEASLALPIWKRQAIETFLCTSGTDLRQSAAFRRGILPRLFRCCASQDRCPDRDR